MKPFHTIVPYLCQSTKVLVVEDEAIPAMELRQILENLNYRITNVAPTGAAALHSIKNNPPDIVLMDIGLRGETDGISTASQIQDNFALPFIYITANSDAHTLRRVTQTRPYGIVYKPFTPEQIRSAVEIALMKFSFEQTIQHREQWYADLFTCMSDGIIVCDRQKMVTYMNPIACDLIGWPNPIQSVKSDVPINDLIIPTTTFIPSDWLAPTLERGEWLEPLMLSLKKLNGQDRIPVEIRASPMRDIQGAISGSVVVLHDITSRLKAEEAIRDLHYRNTLILEAAGEGIYGVDSTGLATFINPSAAKALGYQPEELIGTPLYQQVHRDEASESIENSPLGHTLFKGKSQHVEDARMWRKDGTCFPVQYTITPLLEEGHRHGAVIVFNDMTAQKATEKILEDQNTKLATSNQELDDFTTIISHDLREPLHGIKGFAQMLVEDYGPHLGGEGQKKCETLGRLAERLDQLISTLLYFSKVGRTELSMGMINLQNILDEILDDLSLSLEEHGVTIQVPRPLPLIYCDRARVGEIFRNLITNAMKYNDKEHKWIKVGFLSETNRPHTENLSQGTPIFFVEDNGIGIPERHQDEIFRMFRRLHPRSKFGGGTGGGLALVKKLVERNKGNIWVSSTPGQGSTFYFTLQQAPIPLNCTLETVA